MMEPLTVSQAMDLARQFFSQGQRTWARPMVYVLEQVQPQSALRWALELYQESLPLRHESGSFAQHQTWLDQLKALMSREDVADYCDRVAYEAWGNDPAFNVVERGIARLYWALMNFLRSHSGDYIFQVTSAAGMLADNDNGADAMDEPTLERSIGIFRRMVEQENGSMT